MTTLTKGVAGAQALRHAYPALSKKTVQGYVDDIAQRAAVLKREGYDVDLMQANVRELNLTLARPDDRQVLGFSEWLNQGEPTC